MSPSLPRYELRYSISTLLCKDAFLIQTICSIMSIWKGSLSGPGLLKNSMFELSEDSNNKGQFVYVVCDSYISNVYYWKRLN